MKFNPDGLSNISRLSGGAVHALEGTVLNPLQTTASFGRLLAGVTGSTVNLIADNFKHPFGKQTFKDWKEAIKGSFQRFGEKTSKHRADYTAPFKEKYGDMYGPAKLVAGTTHTLYGGLKYGLGTILDTSRRVLKTVPAGIRNLFVKKDKRWPIWKGYTDRQKKWRGDYAKGFKDLKKTD